VKHRIEATLSTRYVCVEILPYGQNDKGFALGICVNPSNVTVMLNEVKHLIVMATTHLGTIQR
jgi:hypothetical protein